MKLTKDEVKTIQRWYKSFSPENVKTVEEVRGTSIRVVLLISQGLKNLHKGSKYPRITVIGIGGTIGTEPEDVYYLGDSYDAIRVNYGKVGMDSLGKNIFQMWSNSDDAWQVTDFFSPISDLTIGCEFPDIAPTNQIR